MSVAEILDDVARHGVELRAVGHRLRFRPVGKLPSTTVERLREHKTAILAFLTTDTDRTRTGGGVGGGSVGVGTVGSLKAKPETLVCHARCKRCGKPIARGELVEVRDSAHPTGRKPNSRDKRWIPLDRDYVPHGCAAVDK